MYLRKTCQFEGESTIPYGKAGFVFVFYNFVLPTYFYILLNII